MEILIAVFVFIHFFKGDAQFCYDSLTRKVRDGLLEIARNNCQMANDERYVFL